MDQNLDNTRPEPSVWPPPPTSFAPPEADASPLAALTEFHVQNVWLVLLLTFITLGIYAVFWLRRQNATINMLRPDLKATPLFGNIVLAVAFISAGLDIASMISSASSIDGASSILDRIFGLMALVLSFQVRSGFNLLMRVQKGDAHWVSGLWTWLFSVVYLQYKLNKNIQSQQGGVRPLA